MTKPLNLPAAYIVRLRALGEEGLSAGEIARRVSRPLSTVKNHLHKLGIRAKIKPTGRPAAEWTPDDDAALKEMWFDEDTPKTSISHQLKKTWDSVNDRAEFLKLPPRAVKHKKPVPFSWKITPWPKNMPRFDDDPRVSPNQCSLSRAAQNAREYVR